MAALVRTDRAQNWFWGNALNPLDTRTVVKDFGGWREFSGKKSFCSGASDSEMLIASAVDESAGGKLLIAAIPSGRSGITCTTTGTTSASARPTAAAPRSNGCASKNPNCCSIPAR
jgi:alkylation response protein AidB-like acyl-CoA dehydrogenase